MFNISKKPQQAKVRNHDLAITPGFYWSLSPANCGWTKIHTTNCPARVFVNCHSPNIQETYHPKSLRQTQGAAFPGGKNCFHKTKMRKGTMVPLHLDPFIQTSFVLKSWGNQIQWGLIYLFNAYLPNIYYISGCVLNTGIWQKQNRENPCSYEPYIFLVPLPHWKSLGRRKELWKLIFYMQISYPKLFLPFVIMKWFFSL